MKKIPVKSIVRCTIAILLYCAFLVWVKSWLGIIVIPFIYDAYITKKIPWTWWKSSKNTTVRKVMSWVDAIVFALVAVYFINLYFFQNYVIPSSSLEKSLLTGDYLFVSKMSYGPRVPNTPLHMPLTSHTIPLLNCKSYIEWPQWDYRRVKGFGNIKQNDIVVFNYPCGDTVALKMQDHDFYSMCYEIGQANMPIDIPEDPVMQRAVFQSMYDLGYQYIQYDKEQFGDIVARPVDVREHYVKRCVGLPGQTLQIKNGIVYIDNKKNKQPDNVQYAYMVTLKAELPVELCKELGISMEDRSYAVTEDYTVRRMPLTRKAYEGLKKRPDLVASIKLAPSASGVDLFPHNKLTGWSCYNYGPLWIPKKGETIKLTLSNLPYYERIIGVYEHNKLEVKGRTIYINSTPVKTYTFKMDYYWMMGDNRDNSLDSRFWGFVPEDHIVGKPIMIWLSLDKDYGWFDGKIRWNRLFRWVSSYN